MINTQAFYNAPCDTPVQRVFCLPKNIAAIQVLQNDDRGEPRLGMITQLPHGAELQICGEGFNERTVRVRWADGSYFVFLQDIEVPKARAASG